MTWLSLAHCWSRLQTTINQSEISIVLCQPIREEYYSPWPARYWGSALAWEDQWTGVCWSSPLESCCTACTCQSTNQRSVLVCVDQSQSCTDLGLMRSTALISLPHLSHWSPLASLYPHPASGHSPSTNLAKSSLERGSAHHDMWLLPVSQESVTVWTEELVHTVLQSVASIVQTPEDVLSYLGLLLRRGATKLVKTDPKPLKSIIMCQPIRGKYFVVLTNQNQVIPDRSLSEACCTCHRSAEVSVPPPLINQSEISII